MSKIHKKLGYNVIRNIALDEGSKNLFRNLWKEEGITGMIFSGHGGSSGLGVGGHMIYGFRADENGFGALGAGDVQPPYKLSIIIALHCYAWESNWINHVSRDGTFMAYMGKAKVGHRPSFEKLGGPHLWFNHPDLGIYEAVKNTKDYQENYGVY